MFLKKYGDLAVGIAFLVLAVAMFVMAGALPPSLMGGLGSDFMPKVLAMAMAVLAVIQIITGLRKMKLEYTLDQLKEEFKPEYWRVLVTILAFTVYVVVLSSVGFMISSVVYLIVQMTVLAPKEKRNYLLFAVISVAVSVVVYYLFRNGLNVLLPAGLLG